VSGKCVNYREYGDAQGDLSFLHRRMWLLYKNFIKTPNSNKDSVKTLETTEILRSSCLD
jgi:hypothetical protein